MESLRTGGFVILAAVMSWSAAVAAAGAAEFVVRVQTIEETKAVFGQVESRDVVPARARIGGTLRQISVDEGAQVEKGEEIALVVDDKIALQLDAADAQIRALQSQLGSVQTDLNRAQELLKRGISPQSRVDQASSQVDVLTNQVTAAEADRAVIEQSSREGKVLAPASGRILTIPVTPGSVIMAGEAVARVAGGGYFLRLSLPERHAAAIVEGDTVKVGQRMVSRSANGHPPELREGRLVQVYPEIAEGRVQADVEVEGLGDYFVGERTLVWIPVGRRDAIAIPPEAVTTRHGVDYARLAGEPDPLDVAVILGDRLMVDGSEKIEVLSGLREGDRILLP
ncbi:MAG TPA: efflux RND transporter periplasmic adaptor subunit [Aurantimonas coralicida]|uniref:Efflux RND transporter periplasmic adaptor subunit n=2 Tax=root TaxID=1 RepID=A0A9C9NBY5_9HYPH|nr:efflux RND transporter periplasmic adaptor subunit [Aurantimonas coralicida]HET99209.1 efflux RND transporter periplasmic adaptor subunit [Aurantimonas coralicida]